MSKICEPPYSQASFQLSPRLLVFLLYDPMERRRKIEGGQLKIERSPLSTQDIVVGLQTMVGGGEQIKGAAAPETVYCPPDESKGEVDQAVAAKNRVGVGERVACEVQDSELPTGAAEARYVALDELGNDVCPNIQIEV